MIPRCWWRHNGHVEALAALRDHERISYSPTAPATAPMDWLRALRDTSALVGSWTADLACSATHQDPPARLRHNDQDAWETHVTGDVGRRRQAAVAAAAHEPA